MRFKCHLINLDLFLRYCATLSKVSKRCVVFLKPDSFDLAVPSEMGDGMQVWAKTAVRCLFDSYVVESLNNNLIAFELSVENLERALKSAQFSTNCTCKLTKKGGKPYLTFIVEIQAAQIMNVVQDVPVKLLSPAQAALILEPSVSADPREVNICLPSVGKVVRPIVDRLRKLDDVLVVEANMDGVLRLGVQTDSAKISTSITGLIHPQLEGVPPEDQPPRDPNKWASARLEVRKAAKMFGVHKLNPNTAVLSLCERRTLVLYAYIEDVETSVWIYYLPVMVA